MLVPESRIVSREIHGERSGGVVVDGHRGGDVIKIRAARAVKASRRCTTFEGPVGIFVTFGL